MKKLLILFTLFAAPLYAMEQPTTSSIHDAAQKGNLAEVQRWLDQGIDINQQDEDGSTPLFTATLNDHQNIVEFLITHGANINQQKHDDTTPLLAATIMERQNIAECLITHGANVNQQDKGGSVPLHWAISFRFQNIISLLISHGANPLIQDKYLHNAIYLANDLAGVNLAGKNKIKKILVQEREQYFRSHLPPSISMPQFLRNRQHGKYTPTRARTIATLLHEWPEWEQYKKDNPRITECSILFHVSITR